MEEAGRRSVETAGVSVEEPGRSGVVPRGHRGTPAHVQSRQRGEPPGDLGVRRGLLGGNRYSRRCDAGEPCDASRCVEFCIVAVAAAEHAVAGCSPEGPSEHLPSLPLKQCASPLLSIEMNPLD